MKIDFEAKIIKIGNSKGIIVPQWVLKVLEKDLGENIKFTVELKEKEEKK